jgi:hypothetical protein
MPKIDEDRAVARKMSKLRMYDIARSIRSASVAVLEKMEPSSSGDYRVYRGDTDALDWLEEACKEWELYVAETRRELGIC